MPTSTFHRWLWIMAAWCAVPALARAQNFPPDSQWLPLRCRNGVMTDPYRDVPTAINERDVVGDGGAAAGFRAADAQFVYLRVRVDDDPAPGGVLRPSVWGFEFDTDSNLQTYEILVSASGASRLVSVFRNTATTLVNSPADPADSPAVATFPFATHARSVVAAGSNFGGGGDFFVDLAVPWSTLAQLGFGQQTSVRTWAGTSGAADALDGDIACHDGASGPSTLGANASDPTVFGPGGGTGGSGGTGTGGSGGTVGPVGANGLEFEGGPSCSCSAGGRSEAAPLPFLLALAVVLLTRRPRSRARRSTT